MSDISSIPAVYDPNRNSNGHFSKGNQLSRGSNEISKRFASVKSFWLDANSPECMLKVRDELIELCLQNECLEVKLKAIVYYFDRSLGKPSEKIELDARPTKQSPIVNLTPEEILILERMIARGEED